MLPGATCYGSDEDRNILSRLFIPFFALFIKAGFVSGFQRPSTKYLNCWPCLALRQQNHHYPLYNPTFVEYLHLINHPNTVPTSRSSEEVPLLCDRRTQLSDFMIQSKRHRLNLDVISISDTVHSYSEDWRLGGKAVQCEGMTRYRAVECIHSNIGWRFVKFRVWK